MNARFAFEANNGVENRYSITDVIWKPLRNFNDEWSLSQFPLVFVQYILPSTENIHFPHALRVGLKNNPHSNNRWLFIDKYGVYVYTIHVDW